MRAPKANAIAERFVRTVRPACLDWLLILNRRLERTLHAIIIVGGHRKPFWSRFRKHAAGSRYVVSVDERSEVTMIPAEPKRN